MGTPSTATAIHHQHHFYPHNPPYPDYSLQGVNYTTLRPGPTAYASGSGNANHVSAHSTPDPRQNSTATCAPKQASTNASIAYSSKGSPDMPPPKSKRKADWEDFYRNGPPKEVIVIDDSPEPATRPPQLPEHLDAQATVAGAAAGHSDKRRRLGPYANHEVNNVRRDYAVEHSTSTSEGSRARSTLGQYSTAPTSLGSNSSGSQRMARLDNTQIGQKRKRVQRSEEEEEDLEVARQKQRDLWGEYVPPKQPATKAKDVHVKVVNDRSNTNGQKCDDQDGHYIVVDGQSLTDRYQIVKQLGQGTFGKVVEAYDRKNGNHCAIKIIRAVPKYRDASRIELRVLATLASNDRSNRNRCIHFRECFDFRNHICIVTDLLSESVFDFLKQNTFTPFPSTHIQSFAKQLLTSVAFLHDLNLIHTDLKPENILLVSNAYQTFTYSRNIPSSSRGTSRQASQRRVLFEPEIRLIDFGSATFNDEYHSSVVSTRHYRAPEIILNLGWSYPCDIWSIGCILVEFFTGDALFQTHDNLEHLAMMEGVCGSPIERNIIDKVRIKDRRGHQNSAATYFRPRAFALNYPNSETPRQSRKFVKNMKRLEEIIPPNTKFNERFLDLLRKIFVYDPRKRITAHQALKHPWFSELLKDDGTEAKRIQKLKARSTELLEQRRRQP